MYLSVRPYVPKKEGVFEFNSVEVPMEYPLFDPYIPGFTKHWSKNVPDYEKVEINGIINNCSEGDTVVIIGGGFGISAVRAARKVGSTGEVIVYEASKKSYDQINDVINYNSVDHIVECHHAVVGEVISLSWPLGGETGEADAISPENLPQADVYEIDAEGAEKAILENLNVKPRVCIVETHAVLDVPKEEIIPLLRNKGYQIENIVPNDEGCHVLTAIMEKDDN